MVSPRDKLKISKLVFDGAMGTYYAAIYDTKELPEEANIKYPGRVLQIHEEYIAAGADIIRTNTFATNTASYSSEWEAVEKNLRAGYRHAVQAVGEKEVYIAADIGQIPLEDRRSTLERSEEYKKIVKVFLEEGAKIILFETMSDLEDIKEAIKEIGDQAFIIVNFSVNQFGYSHGGLSGKRLIEKAEEIEEIDAIGFNCGIGPGHMKQILKEVSFKSSKVIVSLPNAGYPQIISNRMMFDHSNKDYFVEKVCEIAALGADILGGCCGTTPEYISRIKEKLDMTPAIRQEKDRMIPPVRAAVQDNSFFAKKKKDKLIAVELAPPLGSDYEKLRDAAHLLNKDLVDVLTFPDSPSGRTRADSILMSQKVMAETGIPVMPHICCRDKNAIAMRAIMLGAHINNIRNFLVITGDPIPSIVRNSIKGVFNFDSVGLMRIIQDMNEEQFVHSPVCYGGCINQGRRNLEVEIGRVKKKMEAGASFFLTQPISTAGSASRVRRIKEETGARILCGIMPFVSLKNAMFMKNEMTGIDVTKEVLDRYRADMTKEEGEEAGILLAKEMISLTEDFADGYYFSFPFNRVGMLEKILM